MRTLDEVKFAFTPVGKLDAGSQQRILKLEVAAREFATDIVDLVPECPDRTAALRKLLECKMTAVQAISHAAAPKASTEEETKNEKQSKKKQQA